MVVTRATLMGGIARWLRGPRPASNAAPGARLMLSSRAVVGGAWSRPTGHEFADAAGAEEFVRSLPLPEEPTVLRAWLSSGPPGAESARVAGDWLLDTYAASVACKLAPLRDDVSPAAGERYSSWLDFWETCELGSDMLGAACAARARRSAVLLAATACVEEALRASPHAEERLLRDALRAAREAAEVTATQSWRQTPPGPERNEGRLRQGKALEASCERAEAAARRVLDAYHNSHAPGRTARNMLLRAAGRLGMAAGAFASGEFEELLRDCLLVSADAIARCRAGAAADPLRPSDPALVRDAERVLAAVVRRELPAIEVLRGAAGVRLW